MTQSIRKPDPINLNEAKSFIKFAREMQRNPNDKTPALDMMEHSVRVLAYLRDIAKKSRHDDFDTTDSDVVKEVLRMTIVKLPK